MMRAGTGKIIGLSAIAVLSVMAGMAIGQAVPEEKKQEPAPPALAVTEGSMTLATMRTILKRLDPGLEEPQAGSFRFLVNDFQVIILTAEPVNRMRVMVRIKNAETMTKDELLRIAQANLDSALDARYAIGQNILWSTFIHPLSSLHHNQFIEAIGSTVNLAMTYGTTYNSGQLFFGGGDSRAIIGRKLIDELLKKGQPI